MERDFQAELKAAQNSVKTLGAKREKLVGDARVEEAAVKNAVEALTALGVTDAATMTVDQLNKLRDKKQTELQKNVDALQTQIAAAEKVMTEYESVAA
jgi:hypothetical protein